MIRFSALLVTIAIAGCQNPQQQLEPPQVKVVVRGDAYCKIARKIKWSTRDTKETIAGVRRENSKFDRVCGGPKKSSTNTDKGSV